MGLAVVMAVLGGFANGFTTNISGDLVYLLQKDRGFEHVLDGLVSGSVFLGGAAGCLLGGYLADIKGRKMTAMMGEIIIVMSCMFTTISPHPAAVITFRSFTGIGIGICQAGKPIYVSELTPAKFRGRVLASFGLMYSAGIACTKFVHYGVRDADPATSWRLLVAIGAIPATALLLFIMVFVPESPVWLAMQQASAEEKKGLTEADVEDAGKPSLNPKTLRPWDHAGRQLSDADLRPPVLLSLVLLIIHQFTGASILIL